MASKGEGGAGVKGAGPSASMAVDGRKKRTKKKKKKKKRKKKENRDVSKVNKPKKKQKKKEERKIKFGPGVRLFNLVMIFVVACGESITSPTPPMNQNPVGFDSICLNVRRSTLLVFFFFYRVFIS